MKKLVLVMCVLFSLTINGFSKDLSEWKSWFEDRVWVGENYRISIKEALDFSIEDAEWEYRIGDESSCAISITGKTMMGVEMRPVRVGVYLSDVPKRVQVFYFEMGAKTVNLMVDNSIVEQILIDSWVESVKRSYINK